MTGHVRSVATFLPVGAILQNVRGSNTMCHMSGFGFQTAATVITLYQ